MLRRSGSTVPEGNSPLPTFWLDSLSMEIQNQFEDVCRAMMDEGFYPHAVTSLTRIDTHISAVFLTGSTVYKLKKPLDFGFLDFRKLDTRRYVCEREVLLNQRLTHGVYRGVAAIRRDESGHYSTSGSGMPVEYAVVMQQLPEEDCLRSLLDRSRVGRAFMEQLGTCLAGFYERSARSPEIDHYGDPQVIEFNMEENFEQVAPFVGRLVEREKWDFIRQVSRAFFTNWKELFLNRVRIGRIRDGHGDLRVEHVYFHDGLQIIDCIEFNDRFRYGDVASDLAFLHMDLERMGFEELSRALVAAYVGCANDPGLYGLLDFYAAYRAIVKLKVICLGFGGLSGDDARVNAGKEVARYLEQAYRYAIRFSRPTLWIFCGLPASGKSRHAARTSEALMIPVFQSDVVRKQHMPTDQIVPYGQGIYRSESRNRVYAQLLALAQEQLKQGHSAVLDATFSDRKWREEASRLAADLDTNCIFVECTADEDTVRRRLKKREDSSGGSDARLQHLPDMLAHFQPLDEIPPENHFVLRTERGDSEAFGELLEKAYALKCVQVDGII